MENDIIMLTDMDGKAYGFSRTERNIQTEGEIMAEKSKKVSTSSN